MKPSSYTSHTAQGQRPRGRTGSNSSASSAASAASTKSHDQFVFSPHQTPASEKEPFFSHQEYSSLHDSRTHSKYNHPFLLSFVKTSSSPNARCMKPDVGSEDVSSARFAAALPRLPLQAPHHDGSQVVAPKIIGPTIMASSYNCRGVGFCPTIFMACLVAAQRVCLLAPAGFGEFHTSRCGRMRASGIT